MFFKEIYFQKKYQKEIFTTFSNTISKLKIFFKRMFQYTFFKKHFQRKFILKRCIKMGFFQN